MSDFKGTKKRKIGVGALVAFLLVFYFSLPDPLFDDPLSTVINDRNGALIAAKIAADGQWRFPQQDSIPAKFKTAIRLFEDEYFYYHFGINPISIAKALYHNATTSRSRRGGSTITSQTVRLSRKGKVRSYWEKLIETYLAVRLEMAFSKEELLNLYCSYAPFGGNVVGIEAASWRYYGRAPRLLSWGEVATLAVLPNAPSLIYPGKNQAILLRKRNTLLDKLLLKGEIDTLTCELAKAEPLPGQPKSLPRAIPHLLERAIKEGARGKRIQSTIDYQLQNNLNTLVQQHSNELQKNEIHNAALIVIEVGSGKVMAYVGNTFANQSDNGNDVDIITSERSSGSILKPLLYAFAQQEGMLLPETLLPDVPTQIAGYSPLNFDKKYDGAVAANRALARSLNIPAVRMLQQYGIDKFVTNLKKLGFGSINKSADHYGLSLILGGAEVRLWDLAYVYGNMARELQYQNTNGQSPVDQYHLHYNVADTLKHKRNTPLINNGAAWLTFEALIQMDRPIEGTNWSQYVSSQKIAWKTGTSFGHRDAWAVGITPKYLVASWVGNADGEGRPGLTGARSAAPLMFDAFKLLPTTEWFDTPEFDLIEVQTCKQSGYKATKYCPNIEKIVADLNAERTANCPYHKLIYLDKNEEYQVTSKCYPVNDIIAKPWFILPTVMEWYYQRRNPSYSAIPPLMKGCVSDVAFIDIIYPQSHQKIFIPKSFNNEFEKIVFKATHRQSQATIYWHLDEIYLGASNGIHQMEISTTIGQHTLTLIDDTGESIVRKFEVVGKYNK